MDAQTATSFINSVGFPIFVAIYMLITGSKQNQQTTDALNELRIAVNKLTDKLEENSKHDAWWVQSQDNRNCAEPR